MNIRQLLFTAAMLALFHSSPTAAFAQTPVVIDAASAVRSISLDETPRTAAGDPVGNGIRNGIIAGAAAGAGFGVAVSRLFCETDDCIGQLGRDLPAVLMLAGIGAGIGAVAGWGIDASLDRGPVVDQRRAPASLRVAPVLSRRGRGVRATITWR